MLDSLTCPNNTTLRPGKKVTCNCTYIIKAADFVSGRRDLSLTIDAYVPGVALDSTFNNQMYLPLYMRANAQLDIDVVASTCRQVLIPGECIGHLQIRRVPLSGETIHLCQISEIGGAPNSLLPNCH